jgi:hypothetical protein
MVREPCAPGPSRAWLVTHWHWEDEGRTLVLNLHSPGHPVITIKDVRITHRAQERLKLRTAVSLEAPTVLYFTDAWYDYTEPTKALPYGEAKFHFGGAFVVTTPQPDEFLAGAPVKPLTTPRLLEPPTTLE